MKIGHSPPQSSISSIAATPIRQAVPLKLGNIIEVIVQARLGENQFLLQQLPGGETLSAFSHVDLPLSQRIQIQVVHMGSTPELRILPSSTQAEAVVPQALRELLPKQVGIGELIKSLQLLSRTDSSNLPDSVRLAIENLTAAIPKTKQLFTPKGVQNAVRNSGLFLEATLAASLTNKNPFFGNDIKARLLNLLAAIQESVPSTSEGTSASQLRKNSLPPDPAAFSQSVYEIENGNSNSEIIDLDKLVLKTEGALAKIIVDQLASQPDNGDVTMQLTIPFTEGNYQDTAQLVINSDGSTACNENHLPSWTAAIELQPPGIGKFNAHIVWNGSRIDATLWSDREETEVLMQCHCELLRARLEQIGLEAGNIIILDQPPLLPPKKTDKLPLLDVLA
ncbi:MAG: flagellar hook-length control protein FliK [Methylosarcina sp.]